MSWRDTLRPAYFRGVHFKVIDSQLSVGRSNIFHTYPFKDKPAVEDLGRANKTFTIEGYIAQSPLNDFDYTTERDALIWAFEQEGPAQLVHPFYGGRFVALEGPARIEENFVSGSGVARFTATFVEVEVADIPAPSVSETDAVEEVAEEVEDVAEEEGSKIDPSGPDFKLASIVKDGAAFVSKVRDSVLAIQARATALISGALTTLASIQTDMNALANAPDQFAAAMKNTLGVYRTLLPALSHKEGASLITSALSNTNIEDELEPIEGDTPSRQEQFENRQRFLDMVKGFSLATAAVAAVNMPYESKQQAQEILDQFNEAMDDYWLTSNNDIIFAALQDLRVATVDALLALGASLPTDSTYTVPPDSSCSIIIAHELYDDLTRENEIIQRNIDVCFHPAFITGGEDLEVLSE